MVKYRKTKRIWKKKLKKKFPSYFFLLILAGVIGMFFLWFTLQYHPDKKIKGMKAIPVTPFVSAFEGELYLNGNRFRSVGVNRYNLATTDSPYMGCGTAFTNEQLEQLFQELNHMGVTSLRFWLFQSFTKSGTDFTRFDYLVSLADKYNIKLIPVFENQWEHCTQGGYKQNEWYKSEYKSPYGNYPISLKDYIKKVVPRYKNTTAIMMWQMMNEAETWSTDALYNFVKDISTDIKSLDKNHMVSFGTMGANQPGTSIYRKIHSLPTIDILEVHDYTDANETNPFPYRFIDAQVLNKPIMTGEAGINLADITQEERAEAFSQKMNIFFANGGDVYLIWSYRDANSTQSGGWDFVNTDPLATIIQQIANPFALPTSTPTIVPSH